MDDGNRFVRGLAIAAAIATILGFCVTVFVLIPRNSPNAGTSTNLGAQQNTPGASGSQPTSPVQSAATSTIAPSSPGTVLYTANWSSGMNGWSGPAQWGTSGGTLISSGDNQNYLDIDHTTAFAPYQLTTSNYAVEARIRVISCQEQPSCYGGVGLVARLSQDQSSGWIFGVDSNEGHSPSYSGAIEIYPADNVGGSSYVCNCAAASKPFTPGGNWHTYRAELRGNNLRLYVDGALVLNVTDNRYLSAGSVGLMCFNMQVEVSSFKITAL